MKGFGENMAISDRVQGSIENWSKLWGDRLKTFLTAPIALGIEILLDVIGKAAAPKLLPFLELMEATGKVPPEFQELFNEMKVPTGEVSALFAQSAGGSLIGGAFGKIVDALLLPMAYAVNEKTQNVILTEGQYIMLWLRKFITPDEFNKAMKQLGHNEADIEQLKEVATIRLNPEAIARLWLRDKETFNYLWKDLADSGVTEDRIEALKELAYAMPTPQDLITWMAKEAFEPDAIEKYGLDAEFERLDLSWFDKVGVKEEVIPLYWRAHWQHPAFREITELLHRGEINEDDVYDWYRLVEIPPYWRDKLTSISWDLPNRIELRMMARYGLVDKDFLLEQLKKVGLKEDYRDVAADMMLAMGIRTDLSTRYSKGWLDADGVKAELEASGLSPIVQERMFKWIVKNTGGDRVEKERDLTKTEIYKAIKKGAMLSSQGVELIQDMGYSREEAELLIEINVGVLEGSPETYMALKRITQLYRRSQGLPAQVPSEELIQAEKDVLELDTEEAKIRFHRLLKEFKGGG